MFQAEEVFDGELFERKRNGCIKSIIAEVALNMSHVI